MSDKEEITDFERMKSIYKDQEDTSFSQIYKFLSKICLKSSREDETINVTNKKGRKMKMRKKEAKSLPKNQKRIHEEKTSKNV